MSSLELASQTPTPGYRFHPPPHPNTQGDGTGLELRRAQEWSAMDSEPVSEERLQLGEGYVGKLSETFKTKMAHTGSSKL